MRAWPVLLVVLVAACAAPGPRVLIAPELDAAQYHVRVEDQTGSLASVRIPDDLWDWSGAAPDEPGHRLVAARNVDDSAIGLVWTGGQCDRLTVLTISAIDAHPAIVVDTTERCSNQGVVIRGARLQFDRQVDATAFTLTNLTP
jgi:hypothetical protein